MSRPNLPSLTGLRFFAAFLVVLVHLRESHDLSGGVTELAKFGFIGVGFFYVLSGFVLAWSAQDRPRASFYALRVARIYPLYLVVFAAVLAYSLTKEVVPSPGAILAGLTLTQAWVPDRSIYFGVDFVFWSLSCEAFFYLITPFVEPRLRSLSTAARGRTMLLLVAGIVGLASVGLTGWSLAGWFTYIFPGTRVLEFLFGMTLAHHLASSRRFVPARSVAVLTALAGYSALFVAPAAYARAAVMVIPFGLLLLAFAAADLRGARSAMHWRALQAGGLASYALYLSHNPIIRVWQDVVEEVGALPLGPASSASSLLTHVVVLVPLTLAAAHVLYRVAERPIERALRRRILDPGPGLPPVICVRSTLDVRSSPPASSRVGDSSTGLTVT